MPILQTPRNKLVFYSLFIITRQQVLRIPQSLGKYREHYVAPDGLYRNKTSMDFWNDIEKQAMDGPAWASVEYEQILRRPCVRQSSEQVSRPSVLSNKGTHIY